MKANSYHLSVASSLSLHVEFFFFFGMFLSFLSMIVQLLVGTLVFSQEEVSSSSSTLLSCQSFLSVI